MDLSSFLSAYRGYFNLAGVVGTAILVALALAILLVVLVTRSALQDLKEQEEHYGGVYIPDEQHDSPTTEEQHG